MSISEFINTINSTNSKFKITKNPGISIEELREIENKLKINLPPDLVEFYTFSNGLQGDDFIFNIIPLNEISKETDELGEYLLFSEYLIYSETCGLEIDRYDQTKYSFFYNWIIEPSSEGKIKRNYFADSIIDFIRLYCKKGTFGIFTSEADDNNTDGSTLESNNVDTLEINEDSLHNLKKKWWRFW